MQISLKLGRDLIKRAGSVEGALVAHHATSAAADVLLAHLASINPAEGQRLAAIYDPA